MPRQLAIFPPCYPACVADGADCGRSECRLWLKGGEGAFRCAQLAARVCGSLSDGEIAGLMESSPGSVSEALRSALAKVGPQLAALLGWTLPPAGEVRCRICRRRFVQADRRQQGLCSPECKKESRRRVLAESFQRRLGRERKAA